MGDTHAAPAASPEPMTPFAALPPVMPSAGPSIAAVSGLGMAVDAGSAKDAGRPVHAPRPAPSAKP